MFDLILENVCEPEADCVPLHPPDALHDATFVAFQLKATVPPDEIVGLSMHNVMTGAGAGVTTLTGCVGVGACVAGVGVVGATGLFGSAAELGDGALLEPPTEAG